MPTGTYTLNQLLSYDDTFAVEFGEDTIAQVINDDLEAFNRRIEEQVMLLAAPVTTIEGRLAKYGTSISGTMTELSEHGRTVTARAKPGVNVGFPMRLYGFAAGFSRMYLLQSTVRDVALRAAKAQSAYNTRIQKEIQRALYLSSNYTFDDRHTPNPIDLPVKRLVNADGEDIPNGPNGETFDGSTHTHYNANNGWDNDTLKTAIDDLTEHGHTSAVKMFIDKSDESAVKALTDFEAYPDPRMIFRNTDTPEMTLDLSNTGNRAIGIFGDAEVWVKPWAIADYAFITAIDEEEKPLKFRQHNIAQARGLQLVAEDEDYPLRAENFEAYLGFGVWSRTNGVVYYAGGAAYTDPTIEA